MTFKASDYPPDWKDRIRPAILKRDNYKCAYCGIQNRAYGYRDKEGRFVECDNFMKTWAEKNGYRCFMIVLTIAHSCHDSRCEDENHMAALCQKCHNKQDLPNRLMNRKYKLKNTRHVCPGRK